MRTSVVLLAGLISTSVVEAQTITPVPGAQFMPLRILDATGKLIGEGGTGGIEVNAIAPVSEKCE